VTSGPAAQSAAYPAAASIRRRLLSLIYEALILAAVLLASALPIVMLTQGWEQSAVRAALQAWLVVVCGFFYVRQWSGTGQTLPMKTWRLRLVASDGARVGWQRALARYAAVLVSVATLGLGYAWALVDRDRQFLHDRLAGTRLVVSGG
jgi:uncharacterized RDD family membrane protein YckC